MSQWSKQIIWSILPVALAVCTVGFPQSKPIQTAGDPYPLDKCMVSGEKLGDQGEPIIFEHEGREIRFCSKSCLPKFKSEPKKYLTEIDKEIARQQQPLYPVNRCFVSNEPFGGDMGEPIPYVYKNRLVLFCCKGCKGDFKKDPETYLKKLDEAVVAKQKKRYPFKECVVSGKKLGSMGEPVDYVMANRLFRFCSDGCIKKVKANPPKYLAVLEAADPRQKSKKAPETRSHKGHDH
ncbi:MAG: TRASH domain-containing protein [Planctomycetota bacterium]